MFVDDERRSAGLWISHPEEEAQAAAGPAAERAVRRAAPAADRAAEVSAAHHAAHAARGVPAAVETLLPGATCRVLQGVGQVRVADRALLRAAQSRAHR